jgi:hypothetical protein
LCRTTNYLTSVVYAEEVDVDFAVLSGGKRKAMLLVIVGVFIGLSAALGSSRLIANLLYGLTPNDP